MTPLVKGLVIAVVHLCLVASLGAKLLYDRATQPRVWVHTVPYDPNLPIRGRYVSLQLIVEPRNVGQGTKAEQKWRSPLLPAALHIENGRLVAEAKPQGVLHRPSSLHMQLVKRGNRELTVLDEPVAFFIPEHVPDPSRRSPDEQLWVEVTIPKKGIPRPIRLGVKKEGGSIVPLDLS
ncbi:MAG TPA: hypothetical protein DCR97_07945 [Deltaproteobacteria bacterium]|jgi:hypothetical protein|nr:hypothetical protein [Deltaproteobacteria bacterium]